MSFNTNTNANDNDKKCLLDEKELTNLKTNLEKEGMEKVQTMWKTNTLNEDSIKNVLNNGMKTFEEKTGRPMTYGEMRDLYG